MTREIIENKRSAEITIPAQRTQVEALLEQTETPTGALPLPLLQAITAEDSGVQIIETTFDGQVVKVKVKSPSIHLKRVTLFDGRTISGNGKIQTVPNEEGTYLVSINGKHAAGLSEKSIRATLTGIENPNYQKDIDAGLRLLQMANETKRRMKLLNELRATSQDLRHAQAPIEMLKTGQSIVVDITTFDFNEDLGEPGEDNPRYEERKLDLTKGWLGYVHSHQDSMCKVHILSSTQIEITAVKPGTDHFTFQVVRQVGMKDEKPVYRTAGIEMRVSAEDYGSPETADNTGVDYEAWGLGDLITFLAENPVSKDQPVEALVEPVVETV